MICHQFDNFLFIEPNCIYIAAWFSFENQAAIGSVPLAMRLSCGSIVLSVAVLGILITAPLGALGMDMSYKKFLNKTE